MLACGAYRSTPSVLNDGYRRIFTQKSRRATVGELVMAPSANKKAAPECERPELSRGASRLAQSAYVGDSTGAQPRARSSPTQSD